jgi:hypothetical protein
MEELTTSMKKDMTARVPKRAARTPLMTEKERYPIMLPVARSAAFTAPIPKPSFMLGRTTV